MPINWTSIGLQRYRDINLINTIDAVEKSLTGEYYTDGYSGSNECNVTLPGYGDDLWCLDPTWNGEISSQNQQQFGMLML